LSQTVYENCPVFQNENFSLSLVQQNDLNDLLKVYSDKKSVPFFNSDNCHGDNFYYATSEIFNLILPSAYGLFECSMIAIKAVPEAIERVSALKLLEFLQSNEPLIGQHDSTKYWSYYTLNRGDTKCHKKV
jgi:hypothetical protein